MKTNFELLEDNLMFILNELIAQPNVAPLFQPEILSYEEHIKELHEFIDLAGEYGIAYELIICLLEDFPFNLSGKAAVKLLETGLMMGFKTEREEDADFDRRKHRPCRSQRGKSHCHARCPASAVWEVCSKREETLWNYKRQEGRGGRLRTGCGTWAELCRSHAIYAW